VASKLENQMSVNSAQRKLDPLAERQEPKHSQRPDDILHAPHLGGLLVVGNGERAYLVKKIAVHVSDTLVGPPAMHKQQLC